MDLEYNIKRLSEGGRVLFRLCLMSLAGGIATLFLWAVTGADLLAKASLVLFLLSFVAFLVGMGED